MTTTVNYYKFDISNEAEFIAYDKLKTSLKSQGLTLFDNISSGNSNYYNNLISPLNGLSIELETKYLFNNQWNTAPTITSDNGLRVFDWEEAIYPNNKIKQGMWLTQTPEMIAIRQNTCACGYCGAQYLNTDLKYCTKCLGSEYLKLDDLRLLQLRPISVNDHTFKASKSVPDYLVNDYNTAQQISRLERLKKAQNSKLKDIKNKIESAQIEYDAYSLLIDNDIDFNNVIYYTHTKKFCFGWREPITKPEQTKLNVKLTEIGFTAKYDIEFK